MINNSIKAEYISHSNPKASFKEDLWDSDDKKIFQSLRVSSYKTNNGNHAKTCKKIINNQNKYNPKIKILKSFKKWLFEINKNKFSIKKYKKKNSS